MAKVGVHGQAAGFGPYTMLSGSTSTGDTGDADLDAAFSNWTMQVVAGSCNASVLLKGSLSTSNFVTTLLTWSASSGGGGEASGDMLSVTGKPASNVQAILDAGASSGGVVVSVAATP